MGTHSGVKPAAKRRVYLDNAFLCVHLQEMNADQRRGICVIAAAMIVLLVAFLLKWVLE
jgi:hypothetical protein